MPSFHEYSVVITTLKAKLKPFLLRKSLSMSLTRRTMAVRLGFFLPIWKIKTLPSTPLFL